MCGAWIAFDNAYGIECETHTDRSAVGICVICSRPVCMECKTDVDGRVLCLNKEHRVFLLKWDVVFRPQSEYEADLIQCNLSMHNIMSKSFSLHDHVAHYWIKTARILVFVKKEESDKAIVLLRDLGLLVE